MRLALVTTIAVILGLAQSGCSSISSTHVKRNKDLCGWETTHLRGIPTTLVVPHQFRVEVVETYFESGGNMVKDSATKDFVTTRSVKFDVLNTKEIFTVDFVKPAAGVLETNLDIDSKKQYFTSINNTIQDKTIEEITKSIKDINEAITPLARQRSLTDLMAKNTLTRHEKTIAVALFDVNDPDSRMKIHHFLCAHLNGCNNCMTMAGEGRLHGLAKGNGDSELPRSPAQFGKPAPNTPASSQQDVPFITMPMAPPIINRKN